MNGEDSEEGSKVNEDDDREEGGKELLIVEGDCRVEYDRWQQDVKEKVGAELWERGHPFHHVDVLTKDCPKNHPKRVPTRMRTQHSGRSLSKISLKTDR